MRRSLAVLAALVGAACGLGIHEPTGPCGEDAHVGPVESGALRAALAASVLALMHEGAEARLPHAHVVAERLGELH